MGKEQVSVGKLPGEDPELQVVRGGWNLSTEERIPIGNAI